MGGGVPACARGGPLPCGAAALRPVAARAALRAPERYESSEDDERRLFYVAVTRAQRFLFATWALGRNGRSARPGPYFNAFADAAGVLREDVSLRRRPRAPSTPRAGAAELELTFSTLKPMLECPYRFKLEGVFGFRPPSEDAQGLGKCLHDALAEVHRRAAEGDVVGPEAVPRLMHRHFHLPHAAPATVDRLRAVAADVLARYLTRNAGRLADVELAEKPIEVMLDDDVIVQGRIDVVMRRGDDSVAVVDLKSTHRAQAEALSATQLRLYALGYEALTGALPARTEIWELDSLAELPSAVDEASLAEVRSLVALVARRIRQWDFPPAPAEERCGACPVRGLCGAAAPLTPRGPDTLPPDP